VYGNYVSIIPAHKLVDILAEPVNHVEVGRLMIVESEVLALLVEASVPVATLAAQIVHFVESGMFPAEEFLHIPHRVAVDGLEPFAWETHGYDPRGDIGQVQIETVLHIPSLVSRHQPLNNVITSLVIRDAHLCVDLFDFGFKFFIFFFFAG
jgi:hypothetical protein